MDNSFLTSRWIGSHGRLPDPSGAVPRNPMPKTLIVWGNPYRVAIPGARSKMQTFKTEYHSTEHQLTTTDRVGSTVGLFS